MSAVKKAATPKKKPVASSHPPFADMIKECIIAHPSEARAGVSRPTIKKFLETRYRLDINATTVNNINRAITNGAEKGMFALPKGPSGKVKLSPKGLSHGKENATPPPATKPKAAKKPKTVRARSKSAVKPVKKAPATARSKKATTTKRSSTTKKSVAPAKKTKPAAKPVKKTTTTTKKTARPTATAKKTTTKRAPAKKSITGTKSRSVPSKLKSSAKTTPAKRKAPSKRV